MRCARDNWEGEGVLRTTGGEGVLRMTGRVRVC